MRETASAFKVLEWHNVQAQTTKGSGHVVLKLVLLLLHYKQQGSRALLVIHAPSPTIPAPTPAIHSPLAPLPFIALR
jgi:hypothetical protein